jgi:hypothetical protein
MLPLTSQRSLHCWDAMITEPYAELQLNYIELPADKYPKLDNICGQVSSPSVDKNLVGGVLNVEDIYFKTTLFPNFVGCLREFQKSTFCIDFDARHQRIVRVFEDDSSKAAIHDAPSLPYFGNDFYAKFKTNLASIPVWRGDDDLEEFFSTGYTMMEKPLNISKERNMTPRISILGRKQKLEKILTNEVKVRHGMTELGKHAGLAPENETEDVQKERSRWGVFPFNSPCDVSDRNVKSQNLGNDDKAIFSDGRCERIPDLLQEVCSSEINLLGHIWPEQGPAVFLQESVSTALEPFSGNLNALAGIGRRSSESALSATSMHIIDRMFEKKLLPGATFETFITGEMDGLIDFKMTSVLELDSTRKKKRIEKDANESKKSRQASLEAKSPKEIRGVTVAKNPWILAVQAVDKSVRKRAQFEELDILDLESLSSKRSKWSYNRGQNIPMLFSESFVGQKRASLEQMNSKAETASMVAIVDMDVTSQFNPRPLSVNGRLINLAPQLSRHELHGPSVGLKGNVKDRLLSSTHALRCIPVAPMLPHTFVRKRGSIQHGSDESRHDLEQWECDPMAVGRSMIDMLDLHFKLDARERKRRGIGQRDGQILSGRSGAVGQGQQGVQGRVSLLGRTSRSILKEVAEFCTPLADSATDGGHGTGSRSRIQKAALRPPRTTSMTEFLRYAFLPATSFENANYSCYSMSDATVAVEAADINRGTCEESKRSIATSALPNTNIEAVRMSKYGDESRYAQQKSAAVSTVPAVSESPLETEEAGAGDKEVAGDTEEAGDAGSRWGINERDDQNKEVKDKAVVEEPELQDQAPPNHMDFLSGIDPRSSAERHYQIEAASLVPQTLDLDQMVASYLSMHRLPQAGGKPVPQPAVRLRVNPVIITPSHVSDIPSNQERGDNEMSVGSGSADRVGQDVQVLGQKTRFMDVVESSVTLTARNVTPSTGGRDKVEIKRATLSGKQSQYFSAVMAPIAQTSMVTPSKGEEEGVKEEEVQENDGREIEMNVSAPASSTRFNGLCILVSESFLELSEGSWAITTLAEKYGITCIDTLLKDPVTVIVDSSTAVCVIEEGTVGQVSSLKEFVKQLTGLVYRYSCIWIIIISRKGDEEAAIIDGREGEVETGMRNLFTAISRFPVSVIVRSITESSSTALKTTTTTGSDTNKDAGTGTGSAVGAQLAEMIHLVCNDNANTVCITHNILRERFVSREFLKALQGSDSIAFAEQCDFLQLFPSLNFYTAAQILSTISLKQIAEHLPERISALKKALLFVPPLDPVRLDSAFALFTVHCGLQRSLGRGTVTVPAVESRWKGLPGDRESVTDSASVSTLNQRQHHDQQSTAQTRHYSDPVKARDEEAWEPPNTGSRHRRGVEDNVSGGNSRETMTGNRGKQGRRQGQLETQRREGYRALLHSDNNSYNDDNMNHYVDSYDSHGDSNIEQRQYNGLDDGFNNMDRDGSTYRPRRSSDGHYVERPTDRGAVRETGYGYNAWDRDGEGFQESLRPDQQLEMPYNRRESPRQTALRNESQYFDEMQSVTSSRRRGDPSVDTAGYDDDYSLRTTAGAEQPRNTMHIRGQQHQFQHQHQHQHQGREQQLYRENYDVDDYDRQELYNHQHLQQQQNHQQFQQQRQYPQQQEQQQHSASAVAGRIQDPRNFARPGRR